MKKILFSLAMAFASIGIIHAQELANFARTAIVSPEFNAAKDSVTFRIAGDYATIVKFSGSWLSGTVISEPELKKNAGIWSITLPAPEPEIYTYNFIVDGVPVNDAANIFQ